MKKLLKITLFTILTISVVCLAFTFYLLSAINFDQIDLNKLKKPQSSVEIFYSDKSKMDFAVNSDYIPLSEIPKHAVDALIAVEDKRFYSHNGVDVTGVIRAFKNNLFSGKIKEGGSTITQQLVKNTYLSGEKTFERKVKEISLALQLERKLTKDEIIEKYLNTVYFGENAYGISSAAKKFFNKKASELTLEECATLIACLKAPTYYNPKKNPQKSLYRRNLILDEMFKQNLIDNNSLKVAKNTDLTVNFSINYEYENCLYDEILSQFLEQSGYENSQLNGLKIYTTIDKNFYKTLPCATDYGLKNDFTILVTDNKTRQIIAYKSTVGNIKRTPASTVKPFLIYAPAIDENYICPATKIHDEKTDFDGYCPSNYGDKYYGFISVKDALAKSLNVPSVKIFNMLGASKVKSYAKKLSVEYQNDDLSVALGNLLGGTTLTEISDAYSPFSNGGNYSKSSIIKRVLDKNGKIVYENKTMSNKVFDDSTAFLINDCLLSCAKSGTANKLNSLNFEVCAKTGTNGNDKGNYDAYCIAYTTKHTVAVWIGNGNGSIMSNSISGGNYPTQIVKDVLTALYKNGNPPSFTPPNSVVKISIDKNAYNADCKILKGTLPENETLSFWFRSDYKVENAPHAHDLPFVKDCKITCNNRQISIEVDCDENVYFLIEDENKKVYFDSKTGGRFIFDASFNSEYNFIVTPYFVLNGEIVLGEKIKLPTVKTEGNKKVLDTDWWNNKILKFNDFNVL